MIAYKRDEIISASDVARGFSTILTSITNHTKDKFAIKAAYILRDTIKVLGTNSGIQPITVALFYEDLENPMQGGTGHTQRVCFENNIQFINQTTFFDWL